MVVLAGILIVAAALILFLVVSGDIESAKRYKRAENAAGVVVGQREDYSLAAYGGGAAGMKRRRYRQYEAEFEVDGKKYKGIVQTKQKGLEAGDSIEVRYLKDSMGDEAVVVTRVFYDRLRELIVGFLGGIVLSIVIIYLKINGEI